MHDFNFISIHYRNFILNYFLSISMLLLRWGGDLPVFCTGSGSISQLSGPVYMYPFNTVNTIAVNCIHQLSSVLPRVREGFAIYFAAWEWFWKQNRVSTILMEEKLWLLVIPYFYYIRLSSRNILCEWIPGTTLEEFVYAVLCRRESARINIWNGFETDRHNLCGVRL
jgi:hypothetical protein